MPSPRGVMLAAIFCSSIIATNSLATSLRGHDAAGVQRIAQRDTDKPGQRIEDVAEDLLEAETKQGSEQRVNGADQGDKADQHRQNNYRHFKAGQNIFPSISKKLCDSCSFSSFISCSLPGRVGLITDSTIKVLNIFRISAATTYLASSMVI